MSNALAPFLLSVICSLALVPLVAFTVWRLSVRFKANQIADTDLKITYVIIACVVSFNISEVLKAIYFGLEYFQEKSWFHIIGRVGALISLNIFMEAAHVLTFAAILMRMSELITPSYMVDSREFSFETLGFYLIMGSRLVCPLLAWASLGIVSPFGLYQVEMMAFEAVALAYVTIRTVLYIKKLQGRQVIPLASWILYSNPLVTGILCFFTILWTILLAAAVDPKVDADLTTGPNVLPYMVPSVYSLIHALILALFYQDTKTLIVEPKTPYTGKGMKRLKFAMAEILS